MGAIIRLAKATAIKQKTKRQVSVVELARWESAQAAQTRQLPSQFPTLRVLRNILRTSSPSARSIKWHGVRWPLASSLSSRYVCCPETGRLLFGVIDL